MTLTERDRRILIVLGVFLGIVVIYLLADWALGGSGSGSVANKQRELSEILQQYRTFQKTKAAFNEAEQDMAKAGDVELLSEIETLAQKAGVKELILGIDKKTPPKNPYYHEESVEVRIEKINIVQLMNALYEFEYSPKVLRVREMHVEVRFDNKELMNVRLLVSKYSPLKAGEA